MTSLRFKLLLADRKTGRLQRSTKATSESLVQTADEYALAVLLAVFAVDSNDNPRVANQSEAQGFVKVSAGDVQV